MEELSSELKREKERARIARRLNCEQRVQYDAELAEKESEIAMLKLSLDAAKTKPIEASGEHREPGSGDTPARERVLGSTTPTHAREPVDAPTSPLSTSEHVDAPTSHSSTVQGTVCFRQVQTQSEKK